MRVPGKSAERRRARRAGKSTTVKPRAGQSPETAQDVRVSHRALHLAHRAYMVTMSMYASSVAIRAVAVGSSHDAKTNAGRTRDAARYIEHLAGELRRWRRERISAFSPSPDDASVTCASSWRRPTVRRLSAPPISETRWPPWRSSRPARSSSISTRWTTAGRSPVKRMISSIATGVGPSAATILARSSSVGVDGEPPARAPSVAPSGGSRHWRAEHRRRSRRRCRRPR